MRIFTRIVSIFFLSLAIAAQAAQVAKAAIDPDFYSGNDILFYNPDACKLAATGTGTCSGSTNPEKVWNFLIGKGLTPEQAAGVMGNVQQEATINFDPGISEKSGGGGYGIIQWTGTRRAALEAAAKAKGVDVADLCFQLEYLYEESAARNAKGGGNEWEGLKQQKTVLDATIYWHDNAERSGDTPEQVRTVRGGNAQHWFDQFAGKTASAAPAGETSSGGASASVFLDPGHGGEVPQYIDSVTGLADRETSNGQETVDMLDVANRAKAELEKLGYKVTLSRTSNDQKVNKRDRVTAAQAAKAQIAVSLHSDPNINQVWAQKVGTYREYNGKKVTFENGDTATKSQTYTDAIAAARTESQGEQVTTDPNNTTQAGSFGRDGVPSKGNTSLLQLWATDIPWVYNEISRDVGTTGLSDAKKNAYVKGVVEGIKKTVTGGDNKCDGGFGGGDLAQTTLAYAWPQYKGLTIDATEGWNNAVKKADSEKRYVGGIVHHGIDCGGFVTTLLVDSGFAPNYNYGGKLADGAGATPTQLKWAQANWQSLGTGSSINTAELKPGDVAIKSSTAGSGHTFVYVGDVPGFESKIASASLDERAPMAGKESPTDGDFTWFRKK